MIGDHSGAVQGAEYPVGGKSVTKASEMCGTVLQGEQRVDTDDEQSRTGAARNGNGENERMWLCMSHPNQEGVHDRCSGLLM